MSPELERERQEHLDLLCDMHNALCRLGGMMSLAKQGVFPTADWREFEPKLKALITKSNLQDPDKLERLVREDQDKISREDERAKLDSESDQESSALAATLRRAIMSFREALDKQGRL